MACFTVTLAAACGVTVARHIVAKKENKKVLIDGENIIAKPEKWSNRLKYLELSLYGGSLLLAGEHLIHGEVTVIPPFLTALSSKEATQEMFVEMGTVGVPMLLAIVLVWIVAVFAVSAFRRKRNKKAVLENK